VITLKYGRLLEEAFKRPGGEALQRWIDDCPNDLYSALTFEGGGGFRRELEKTVGTDPGIRRILADHDDAALHRLMTNLGGHDMDAVVAAFDAASKTETPTCFVAYTVKGWGLPFAGHKDNHAGLMNIEQMAAYRAAQGIAEGEEWEPFAGLNTADEGQLRALLDAAPYAEHLREKQVAEAVLPVPKITISGASTMSTQEGFGKIMIEVAKSESAFSQRVVTTSPDVTVSTNLGGWVNLTGLFARAPQADVFKDRKLLSALKWVRRPEGQHIELGIAENNLFLMLGALGLADPLFGKRLIPVGTVYDPFVARGLDALNYACYQDARFIVAGTPSGITLAPEGGAHQSVITPLIGMGQPGLTMYEPAYVDELAAILRWSFDHVQQPDGGSVYLRLSTRPLEQLSRRLDADAVVGGAYWLKPPEEGTEVAIIVTGTLAPEAMEAVSRLGERYARIGLLMVTSSDRLHAEWQDDPGSSRIDRLLTPLARDAGLVTVLDGHPATLSWMGAVRGHRIAPLGVSRFGQSGDIPDLYASYGINADAIVAAAERTLARRRP
jgi:pyruvate dehydrogenase E1 component